jgi:hypothetical protein
MDITSNIPFVIGNILAKFRELGNPETVSRAAAVAIEPELRHRIHVEGKKTDGSAIGTYSNSYLKIREKNNRGTSSKVIISLTRQLENGYTLKATEKGYTIGNTSPSNEEIIGYLTEKYGDIWQLTEKERELTQIVANETALLIMNK